MDNLYSELYLQYVSVLQQLHIGYTYDRNALDKMMDLIGIINAMRLDETPKDYYKYINMYYE